ncbi:MAG: hypothetical protein IJQ89_12000 [Bacteroidales bacterium]|nr:hypothetical protein [Bacteroidales bacterium]
MKKLSFFSMMCLTALSIVAIISCTKNDDETEEPTDSYVDLGLPSGTKWKNVNETKPNDTCDFYTYDEAMEKYGSALPTKEQFDELKSCCQWTWNDTKKGCEVVGPNSKSIFMPAVGYRNCDGSVGYVGYYGSYWSSSPYDRDYAFRLLSSSYGGAHIHDVFKCMGLSVRLVQN